MSTFLDSLRWRYATKKFDPQKKLSDAQVDELLEALRLTPTSFGLQPYKFIVINDPALRSAMRDHAWHQSQVTDASHLIAICAKTTMSDADIDAYIADIAHTRGVDIASLHGYRDMMKGYVKQRSPDEVREWLMRQSYIALGVLLCACAELRIDACPMEGFDRAKINDILGLTNTDYGVSTICPVGIRAQDDAFANAAKVRSPKERLVDKR